MYLTPLSNGNSTVSCTRIYIGPPPVYIYISIKFFILQMSPSDFHQVSVNLLLFVAPDY